MSQVVRGLTMALDGFVTAPDDGLDRGLGYDGEVLGRVRVLDSPFATHIRFRVLEEGRRG